MTDNEIIIQAIKSVLDIRDFTDAEAANWLNCNQTAKRIAETVCRLKDQNIADLYHELANHSDGSLDAAMDIAAFEVVAEKLNVKL